jgi:hypothetical protein
MALSGGKGMAPTPRRHLVSGLCVGLALLGTLASTAVAGAPRLRCGETVVGELGAGGAASFEFPARAGDVVRLHAAGSALPTVTLRAPDASPIPPTSPLPLSGVYTVELGGGAAGGYGLTLEGVSGSINGGGNGWPPLVCGSGVPDGALSIACGQTRGGALDVVGDSDVYSFLAESGDLVTITIGDVVPGFDPQAELFAPGGALLALSDQPACRPSQACASGPLPAAGVYTIRVWQPSALTTGAYTLELARNPCASDCQDGVDNDGDGLIDFPADLGCANADDLSERRECNDGYDNDGDGFTDFAGGDLGCPTNNSTIEDAQCDDGRDNDLDGAIDADGGDAGPPDAQCAGDPSVSTEAPQQTGTTGCGIGPELLGLGLLLALRRRTAGALRAS